MRADQSFARGGRVDLAGDRRDAALGGFAEYGLTDDLTLQLKGDWQDGEEAALDYVGRGPAEIGVTWQAWRTDEAAASLYVGYAIGGEGRNAGYAVPGAGDRDYEIRGSFGRSFGGQGGRAGPERTFVEVQVARRWREGLPDEVRADVTAGAHLGSDWMVLGQAFAGASDGDGARWLSLEASAVRHFGPWSVQAGWRQAVAGRDTPVAGGPVVALWRRF